MAVSSAQASSIYLQVQNDRQLDSVLYLRESAFEAARNGEPSLAASHIDAYIKKTLDLDFVKHSNFSEMEEFPSFVQLEQTYLPRFQWGPIIYIYAGLIGLFIVIMFNVQREKDRVATALLSILIFIHSFFIVHVGLHAMNYNLYIPHLYSTSTVFSFLYGPLLYFYYKRIKTGYQFKWLDGLHLLPTLVLIVLFIPVFVLPSEEKLKIMLGVGIYADRAYGVEISFVKMLSLLIYSGLTLYLFLTTRKSIINPEYKPVHRWQRNLVIFQILFTLVYCIYFLLYPTS